MEKIDILLTTYNGEKYLKEQLDSILAQTHSNFRLLISDDCSSDNTIELLKEYEQKDNRIKVFYQSKNLGSTKNFEFLLAKVESELYALADQDDIWLPEKIEKAIEKIEETGSDLYFSDLTVIDENGREISKSFWKEKGFYKKIKRDKMHKGLLLNNYVTGCTIVSKKVFIKDILPLKINSKYIIHDYWIAIVMSQKGKIIYDETPYIKYRQHDSNQVGHTMKSKELKSINEIRTMFIDIKIDHFKVFEQNKELFDIKIQKQNSEALKYFQRIQKIKYINFKKWFLFYRLYKYENAKYFIANFIILNIPCFAKIIFKTMKLYK